MAAGVIPGKLVQMKINGSYVRCQTDITLNLTQDVTDDDPCKPSAEDTYKGGTWGTHTVGSRGWTVSMTAKTFADVVAGLMSNHEVSELMINGDPSVEVTIQPMQTSDYDFAAVWLYEGTGTITSLSLAGTVDGDSTWDMEITGNGPLTYERTPVVVTP